MLLAGSTGPDKGRRSAPVPVLPPLTNYYRTRSPHIAALRPGARSALPRTGSAALSTTPRTAADARPLRSHHAGTCTRPSPTQRGSRRSRAHRKSLGPAPACCRFTARARRTPLPPHARSSTRTCRLGQLTVEPARHPVRDGAHPTSHQPGAVPCSCTGRPVSRRRRRASRFLQQHFDNAFRTVAQPAAGQNSSRAPTRTPRRRRRSTRAALHPAREARYSPSERRTRSAVGGATHTRHGRAGAIPGRPHSHTSAERDDSTFARGRPPGATSSATSAVACSTHERRPNDRNARIPALPGRFSPSSATCSSHARASRRDATKTPSPHRCFIRTTILHPFGGDPAPTEMSASRAHGTICPAPPMTTLPADPTPTSGATPQHRTLRARCARS
jgi:hypothetical protein